MGRFWESGLSRFKGDLSMCKGHSSVFNLKQAQFKHNLRF